MSKEVITTNAVLEQGSKSSTYLINGKKDEQGKEYLHDEGSFLRFLTAQLINFAEYKFNYGSDEYWEIFQDGSSHLEDLYGEISGLTINDIENNYHLSSITLSKSIINIQSTTASIDCKFTSVKSSVSSNTSYAPLFWLGKYFINDDKYGKCFCFFPTLASVKITYEIKNKLNKGAKNTFKIAAIPVFLYTEIYKFKEEVGKDENGNPIEEELTGYIYGLFNEKMVLSTIDIYTHPGSFSFDAGEAGEKYIKDVLTKTNIDTWISYFEKAYKWKTQGTIYSTKDLDITSGNYITAKWFKNCLTARNALSFTGIDPDKDIKGGPNGTFIKADLINALNIPKPEEIN